MSTARAIAEAVSVLRNGGVVLHATEGVWGLACDPFDDAAVRQIFELKGRPANKGLILIGGSDRVFEPELVRVPADVRSRIRQSWPGANSWVLPTTRFSELVTGGRESVAVRVPGHEQAQALAAAFGGPLVSTSANRTGEPPATSMRQADALELAADHRLAGEVLAPGSASTLRLPNGEVLRG